MPAVTPKIIARLDERRTENITSSKVAGKNSKRSLSTPRLVTKDLPKSPLTTLETQ